MAFWLNIRFTQFVAISNLLKFTRFFRKMGKKWGGPHKRESKEGEQSHEFYLFIKGHPI